MGCRIFLIEGTRNEKEETSRYIYYVETLKDGKRVYLQRPANKHVFDFLVCVENISYATSGESRINFPKHVDIGNDLIKKKDENPK